MKIIVDSLYSKENVLYCLSKISETAEFFRIMILKTTMCKGTSACNQADVLKERSNYLCTCFSPSFYLNKSYLVGIVNYNLETKKNIYLDICLKVLAVHTNEPHFYGQSILSSQEIFSDKTMDDMLFYIPNDNKQITTSVD